MIHPISAAAGAAVNGAAVNGAAVTGAAVTGTVGSSGTGSSSTSALPGNNTLGKDAFLKLLVAQLRYQDPSKPTDASQFLAETAQFTLVEKFDSLATANQQVLNATQTQAATGMVGKQVSWTDSTGTHSGAVTGVSITDGVPSLKVGELQVALSSVTEVKAVTAG
jgi:flagellar basal-body rod modification protein FlgD